jgi:hypothetical protein
MHILQNPANSKIEEGKVQIIWVKGVRVAEDAQIND